MMNEHSGVEVVIDDDEEEEGEIAEEEDQRQEHIIIDDDDDEELASEKMELEKAEENPAKRPRLNNTAPPMRDVIQEKSSIPEQPRTPRPPCTHHIAMPPDRDLPDDLASRVAPSLPKGHKMAKEYPFVLDPFQEVAVACIERGENVLVAAHTSAGKTAVAEYAVAKAFNCNQRVVYTSPIKALSNQKYRELCDEFDNDVGLMTGDVTLLPSATCIVMTTEILRSMLYRGSEILREVGWVIFDEVHYMTDRERGVVWEESIIGLPSTVKMVFLSATLSNAQEFAAWIANVHKTPCHVVTTDYRPTPLEHYAYAPDGKQLHLILDQKGVFRSQNFKKLRQDMGNDAEEDDDEKILEKQRENFRRNNRDKRDSGSSDRKDQDPRAGKSKARKGGGPIGDLRKLVQLVQNNDLLPCIVFSFNRRECEHYAMGIQKMDFTTEEEKDAIKQVYTGALEVLKPEDRSMPAVEAMLPLLQRGIGVHHSGLLPILKELVEILFQESLVKVLFATETFAMGLNMPARTVVFTNLRKWDGDANRWIQSGEYIQMSGRAGRRGKDKKGVTIIMADPTFSEDVAKEMLRGKSNPLVSSFRLSYYTILNLLARVEGLKQMEHVIRHSFHQFQHEQAVPVVEAKIQQLEGEAAKILGNIDEEALTNNGALLNTDKESALTASRELADLRRESVELKTQIQAVILQPQNCLRFLRPGRLVSVQEPQQGLSWGWGVVLNVMKRKPPSRSPLNAIPAGHYLVDTLLVCDRESVDNRKPKPAKVGWNERDVEVAVIPVRLTLLNAISSIRIALPEDVRSREARLSVGLSLQECCNRFPNMEPPPLDPIEDMEIEDQDLIENFNRLEEVEKLIDDHPLNNSKGGDSAGTSENLLMEAGQLQSEAAKLKAELRNSQLSKFNQELRARCKVLRKLGHIDVDGDDDDDIPNDDPHKRPMGGVLKLKAKAAKEVDTADELLVSELMLDGVFSNLNPSQCAAIAMALLPTEKSTESSRPAKEIQEPLKQLEVMSRKIGEVQKECGIEIDVDDYVKSFRTDLCEVVYRWSKGAAFKEICKITDVFEGSIIRSVRRLDELISQLSNAARAIGNSGLADKFSEASKTIRRDVIFANSLYVES